ncbi:MAG: hypothetical protein ACPG49_09335 [Chitinophagales bacterium]
MKIFRLFLTAFAIFCLVSFSNQILAQQSLSQTMESSILPSLMIHEQGYTTAYSSNTVCANISMIGRMQMQTVHYDLLLLKGKSFSFSGNIGFGLLNGVEEAKTSTSDLDFTVPVAANFFWGKSNHHFELGLGASLLFGMEETPESFTHTTESGMQIAQYKPAKEYTSMLMNASIGYRYQNLIEGGLFFKASIIPAMTSYTVAQVKNESYLGFNIGIGYTFKKSSTEKLPYD